MKGIQKNNQVKGGGRRWEWKAFKKIIKYKEGGGTINNRPITMY